MKKNQKNIFLKFQNILNKGTLYFEQFLNPICIFNILKKFYSQFEYADQENELFFITRVHIRYPV